MAARALSRCRTLVSHLKTSAQDFSSAQNGKDFSSAQRCYAITVAAVTTRPSATDASNSAIPKVAVVIGATGFVGSHVAAQLLQKGYMVRGTCRDMSKGKWLEGLAAQGRNGSMEVCPLTMGFEGPADADIDRLFARADVVFNCAGVEHQKPETVAFMVNSALATVRGAKRHGVGCVVLTSSGGTTNPPGHKNETPKNELLHWSIADNYVKRGVWSGAAKTLMEIAALREVGRNQQNEIVDGTMAEDAPRLCIMNPNLILGPQLDPGPISGNSLPWMARILKGETMHDKIPNDSMSIIDVRDLAALHIACAEKPNAIGRYFGVNRSWRWEEILAACEIAYPGYKQPARFEGEAATPTQFDHTRKNSLGVTMRPLEDTMRDLVAFMRERSVMS